MGSRRSVADGTDDLHCADLRWSLWLRFWMESSAAAVDHDPDDDDDHNHC